MGGWEVRWQEEGCRYKNLFIYLMNREKVKVRKKEMPNQIVSGRIWFMKDAIEDGLRLFD